jgi:uncharacterized protein YjiS (DUF1127 family)
MAAVLANPAPAHLRAHLPAGGSRGDRARPSRARALMPALRVLGILGIWLERTRQRRALLRLPDALLDDIGITRAEAWQEGTKPFWRA